MLKEILRKRMKETTPLSDDAINLCLDWMVDDIASYFWAKIKDESIKQAIQNIGDKPDD